MFALNEHVYLNRIQYHLPIKKGMYKLKYFRFITFKHPSFSNIHGVESLQSEAL